MQTEEDPREGGRVALQAGSWWSVVDLGDDATGYRECGEGSGPTCPQSGRSALEGGSEDNCLPEGNEGSEGFVPAGRGFETVVVR